MSIIRGSLYIVATPIGNLGDISPRALDILAGVDLIIAEDTRHSSRLMNHFNITTPISSYHEYNERGRVRSLINRLKNKETVAMISDAGTPLVSDPGYRLVAAAHAEGIRVIPVPGASALVSAMSVAGIATDRFVFEGYLPAKRPARRKYLSTIAGEKRTFVFYEAPHRIVQAIEDMVEYLGAERMATLAKEMTKQYETIRRDSLVKLLRWLQEDEKRQRGEFVVVVEGDKTFEFDEAEACRVLRILMGALSLKQAVSVATEILGGNRNRLYELAIKLRDKK